MNLLTKKSMAVIVIAVIVVAAVSVYLLYPKPEVKDASFSDDFENGLDLWTTSGHVPDDPNNPGHSVEWNIELSTNQSVSPNHSALFTIDGLQDDGAIWIERKLTVEPNAVKNVNVTFELWSVSESFNTMAVVIGYAGSENPSSEGDFEVIGPANQVEGWMTYSFSREVTADSNGDIYVALGISVVWETQITHFVDDVNVQIS
jgi:hypothetical protein